MGVHRLDVNFWASGSTNLQVCQSNTIPSVFSFGSLHKVLGWGAVGYISPEPSFPHKLHPASLGKCLCGQWDPLQPRLGKAQPVQISQGEKAWLRVGPKKKKKSIRGHEYEIQGRKILHL